MAKVQPIATSATVTVVINACGERLTTLRDWARWADDFIQRIQAWPEVESTARAVDLRCPVCGNPWEIIDGLPACCAEAEMSWEVQSG